MIGALSLRTRGVYFIMITLAFAQMAYYIVAGLARYGGDDGLTIEKRSQFFAPINLSNKMQFYYLCLALLFASIYLVWRIVNSRFGLAIQGARSNDTRMRAHRLPDLSLQAHLLRHCRHAVRPRRRVARQSHRFRQPGDDVLDAVRRSHHHGRARRHGLDIRPVVRRGGALLVLEEVLSGITEYWQIILGPLLLLVVLFARGGIDGLLGKMRQRFTMS